MHPCGVLNDCETHCCGMLCAALQTRPDSLPVPCLSPTSSTAGTNTCCRYQTLFPANNTQRCTLLVSPSPAVVAVRHGSSHPCHAAAAPRQRWTPCPAPPETAPALGPKEAAGSCAAAAAAWAQVQRWRRGMRDASSRPPAEQWPLLARVHPAAAAGPASRTVAGAHVDAQRKQQLWPTPSISES